MEVKETARKEVTWAAGKELIEVWRHGPNDYAVYFHDGDFSVRGTLLEVMDGISEHLESNGLTKDDLREV